MSSVRRGGVTEAFSLFDAIHWLDQGTLTPVRRTAILTSHFQNILYGRPELVSVLISPLGIGFRLCDPSGIGFRYLRHPTVYAYFATAFWNWFPLSFPLSLPVLHESIVSPVITNAHIGPPARLAAGSLGSVHGGGWLHSSFRLLCADGGEILV